MPTYDMACKQCQNAFEIKKSMTEDLQTPCPKCGGETRQVFSPPSSFTRNIDHPDSPLDDLPNAEKMRKQADWAVNKALRDMNR